MSQRMTAPCRARIRFNPSPDAFARRGVIWGWRQVAEYLGVSEATAKRWHRTRPMPLVQYGSTWATTKSALESWILSRGREKR